MKIECSICKSSLRHRRIDDNEIINKINHNGKITTLYSNSNGYDLVYCSKNRDHKLTPELECKVLDLVNLKEN